MIDDDPGRRRQRFSRSASQHVRLTSDDLLVLRHVARHRFLRSTQLTSLLLHRPPKKLIERIGQLYHAGYLDRPRAQLDYFDRVGSAPLVYSLGHRAASVLPELPRGWRPGARTVRRPYIEHTLMIADVIIAFERAVATRKDVVLIDQRALALELSAAGKRANLSLSQDIVVAGRRYRVPVIADVVFALRYASGRTDYFFVEADRGTMTLDSRDLSQSSFRRKLVGYYTALKANLHIERFGFANARVLTVTNSQERVAAMTQLLNRVTRGHKTGRFLFIDQQQLLQADPLSVRWRTNAAEVTLLDGRPWRPFQHHPH